MMMGCSKIQIYKNIYINFTQKHNNFQNKQNQTKDEYIYIISIYHSINDTHTNKYIQSIDDIDHNLFTYTLDFLMR